MGPTLGRQDPGGPHVGPMNFTIKANADCTLYLSVTPLTSWICARKHRTISTFSVFRDTCDGTDGWKLFSWMVSTNMINIGAAGGNVIGHGINSHGHSASVSSTIIGSNNGTWYALSHYLNNVKSLLLELFGANFSYILIDTHPFKFKKCI